MTPAEMEKLAKELKTHMETCGNGSGCVLDKLKEVQRSTAKRCAEIATSYGNSVNKDKWTVTHTMAGLRIDGDIKKEFGIE